MNIAEVRKLREGEKVLWPEGANGCAQAIGIVHPTSNRDCVGFIKWDDGQVRLAAPEEQRA